ncbi:hypothetical protein GH733_013573 [Mirounga leonina]|nr:hypothetical protein GH733_013573 [Mirounga leonina]
MLSNCDLIFLSLSLTQLFLHGLLFLDAIQLIYFQRPSEEAAINQVRRDIILTLTPVITVSYEVKSAFLFFSVLEFAVGILTNAFIFFMNFWDVVRRQPLGNCDLIPLSLSLTQLFLHGLLFLDAIQLIYFQRMKDPLSLSYQTIIMLWMITNQAGLWLTTCLSLLYCSKIMFLSHHPALLGKLGLQEGPPDAPGCHAFLSHLHSPLFGELF